jgi:hypothetical protein
VQERRALTPALSQREERRTLTPTLSRMRERGKNCRQNAKYQQKHAVSCNLPAGS